MLTLEALYKKASCHMEEVNKLFSLELNNLREMALQKVAQNHTLSFFAPIYVSNVCQSECGYCAFRMGNKIKRRVLTYEEAKQEVIYLKAQGYDSIYCLSGSFVEGDISKVGSMTEVNARGIRAIYELGLFPVLESSPFSKKNLEALLKITKGAGRYVLFQECYDKDTYISIHCGDRYKGDPNVRIRQIDLALDAGWTEVGIGVLIGLHHDVAKEISCLIAHFDYLKNRARKITISVPRINVATGIKIKDRSSDDFFLKTNYIIKIMRPEALIVLTGRETSGIRDILRPVTDIWGAQGSTVPGGYTLGGSPKDGQFQLCDRRSVSELKKMG